MNEKDIIIFPNSGIVQSSTIPQTPTVIRARSFKVETASQGNFDQYVRAAKAYDVAGMPFEHIANVGDFLGDHVERQEVDVPLQVRNKVGEVVEDDNQILIWQSRGEKISVIRQLASPSAVTGKEVVPVSHDLTNNAATQNQTLEVLEGINVVKQDSPALPDSTSLDQERANSSFFKPIQGDLQKAA